MYNINNCAKFNTSLIIGYYRIGFIACVSINGTIIHYSMPYYSTQKYISQG